MKYNKRLMLIDGSSYLYRAFYALPTLTNEQGFPTGAIYGVINMIHRLHIDYPAEYRAIIFDAPGKTFRNDLYAAYKATRRAMPPELIQQIAPLHEIIHALGLPIIMESGVEADDVIGTLATQAILHDCSVFIVTGDKDFAQLVGPQISLIDTMTHSYLDPIGVSQKFGVFPDQIVDYLALIGDKSDNIPGVLSVGPKTAQQWLKKYGCLENIMAQSNQIAGKAGSNLRAALSFLKLAKQLITIVCTVPLPVRFDTLSMRPVDQAKLIECYTTLGFKRLLDKQLSLTVKLASFQDRYAQYETILTQEHFKKWIALLAEAKCFALDTETTDLHYMRAELVGISFALKPGQAAYIPLSHRNISPSQSQLDREWVLAHLQPILENSTIQKIGQNIKYDIAIFAKYKIQLCGVAYDTLLESYVLRSGLGHHDLDSLALKHLNWETIKFHDVVGKGRKKLTFDQVAIEQAAVYAAEDADVTLRLHHVLWPSLEKETALKNVFQTIEIPLIGVLVRMERNGVMIDISQLQQQERILLDQLSLLQKKIAAYSPHPININSPKQLQRFLFEELKLPMSRKTALGQPSTVDAVLQGLAVDFEVPRLIIEYRAAAKLQSTYTYRLVQQIEATTGRLHTSYHQAGTITGRLSSSNPNLQNIPAHSPEGRRIRQAFIAPPGYQLICADYSQIELRLMAHLSGDSALLAAFSQNQDIHCATASEVWGVPIDQVSHEMRRQAKAINFGLIYGMSAFGLARQIGIKHQEAQNYIDRYFTRYPGVKQYMDATRMRAIELEYVETLRGRRLYLPNIKSSQEMHRKAAERAAINAPLQGSAADIIKLAMIQLDYWLTAQRVDAKMIMQVHDELVFEVVDHLVSSVSDAIRHHMTTVVSLRVPLLVVIGIGRNWDEASVH